jgi:hypothetical protein
VDLDGKPFRKSERPWIVMESYSENSEASGISMEGHSENSEVPWITMGRTSENSEMAGKVIETSQHHGRQKDV